MTRTVQTGVTTHFMQLKFCLRRIRHPDPFEHKLGQMHAWNELPRRIRSPLPVANARTLIEDKTGTQGCVQQVHITHTMLNAFVCQRIIIMSLDQVVPNGIEPL
jgi:hypothetical protein